MRAALVIMVKEPRPGRVKTRLGRDIGMVAAAWWFRHQTRRLIQRLRDPRWDLFLAVSPDAEGLISRTWPPDLQRIPQGSGDLGDRMGRILRSFSPGPVCIIGADVPEITKGSICEAFAALGSADCVFGPAHDGGYWLVGVRTLRLPSSVLQNVRWSSSFALTDSERSFGGLRIARVRELRDVDTASDLSD